MKTKTQKLASLMKMSACLATISGALFGGRAAFAGTILTANLPPGTAIININAKADGAANFNSGQSLWYSPFGSGTVLQYTVAAGTYQFRIVNPADAALLYPTLTTAQVNQIYTGWTFNSPWVTDYLVFDSTATNHPAIPQLFDGAYTNAPFYPSASAAYNAAMVNGSYNKIRTSPLGRAANTFTNSYTFAKAETLVFVVPDYALGDNNGGVSVLITPWPQLRSSFSAGTLTFQWPVEATGYILSSTADFQNGGWGDVTTAPTIIGANYSVSLPVDPTASGLRLFRLRHL